MMLSKGAIKHFRTSTLALNYLAQLEHAYSPEDLFFATVLFNSIEQRGKLISDKRRLVMEAPSKWIGWDDRNRFPPGSYNPSYLFIRPFNALGDFFGESKLLDWIKVNHLDGSAKSLCKIEELGMRDECFQDILKSVSSENQIIVIPVSAEMLAVALNLHCSLTRNRIHNIIFWALDIEAHETLLEKNYVAFFNSGLQITQSSSYKFNVKALRQKPQFLLQLMEEGFDVWYLDADCVVVREFATAANSFTKEPYSADILVSIAEEKSIPVSESVGDKPPTVGTGMMFFKSNPRTIKYLNALKNLVESDTGLTEQVAVRKIMGQPGLTFTGIGLWRQSEKYPVDTIDKKSPPKVIPDQNVKSSFVEDITDFFSFSAKDNQQQLDIKIHFLDQLEFVNGNSFFSSENIIDDFSSVRVVHASGLANPESIFRGKDLWYLDKANRCTE